MAPEYVGRPVPPLEPPVKDAEYYLNAALRFAQGNPLAAAGIGVVAWLLLAPRGRRR